MTSIDTLLTDHLDLWTSAIARKFSAGRGRSKKFSLHGIDKLRALILDLAVRGKLVPQDPEDEPASALLKRLKAEKAKLSTEGKIKKSKTLLPIQEEEKPFDIPNGWQWMRLNDLAIYIQRGKGPQYDDQGSVLVVSQKCIQWDGFRLDAARRISDDSLSSYQPERFLQDGDLLWNSTGTGTVGRACVLQKDTQEPIVADSHVTIVRTCFRLSSYILQYLSSQTIQSRMDPQCASPLVSGTTNQVELNTSAVGSLPIPLPPLAEQHRIVAKVDELMALCDRLEAGTYEAIEAHQLLVTELLATLTAGRDAGELADNWARIETHFDTLFVTEDSVDQLKQTILQLAVRGRLVGRDTNDGAALDTLTRSKIAKSQLIAGRKNRSDNDFEHSKSPGEAVSPAHWAWAYLSDFSIIQGGKRLPAGASFSSEETGNIYIRVTDMKEGTIVDGDLKYISDDVRSNISRYTIDREDIYITIAGTIGSVGEVPEKFHGQNLTENAAKIVFRHIDKKFLLLSLSSGDVQFQFQQKTQQMAQPKLALKRIAGTRVPIPPLAEQCRIVRKFDELMGLCEALKSHLSSASEVQVDLADTVISSAVE